MNVSVGGWRYRWTRDRALEHFLVGHFRLESSSRAVLGATVTGAGTLSIREAGDGNYVLIATGERPPRQYVELIIFAPRQRVQRFAVTLDPDRPDLGVLPLAPEPIRVVGRALDQKGDALPDATVTVEATSAAEFPVALRTPLAMDHAAGAPASVSAHTLHGSVLLHAPARAADRTLWIDDASALSVGSVLGYGPNWRRAYLRVARIPGGPLVELVAPVVRSTGDSVDIVLPAVPDVVTTLARPARAGDGIVWLTDAISGGLLQLEGEVAETGILFFEAASFLLEGVPSPIALSASTPSGLATARPVELRQLARSEVVIDLVLE